MLTSLLFLSSAHAWNHTQLLWNREFFPLEWYMSDYRTETIGEEYQLDVIATSYENWIADAPCAQLTVDYKGIRENHYAGGRSSEDSKNTFYYDDPNDEQGAGVLGVTYTVSTGVLAFNREGQSYTYSRDSDIVFSKDIPWIESPNMAADCSGTPIEAVATHEIGHQWGMGHSCEEDEVSAGLCEDQDLRAANMFWAAPDCQSFRSQYDAGSIFTGDDVEGMTALYGPYATFEATSETFGPVGLNVCFSLIGFSESTTISSVDWLFGDGTEANVTIESPDDYDICHVYEEKGQYTINVNIRGNSADCEEWEYTDRKRSMVVICEAPQPAQDFDGIFTYTHSVDKTYQMINQADTSVYGCIDRVSWDVFDGNEKIRSISAWSPKIEFPDYGEYRVVLNLGGPGGVTAEELTVVVEEQSGCSSVPNRGAGLLIVVCSLFGLAVRRRET